MAKTVDAEATLPLRQWVLVMTGVLVVAVPWWLGLVWIVRTAID